MDNIRSPFFYVGDKYKLMPQLKKFFPEKIINYIEPFVGGGSSFLNLEAENYYLNDLNNWIIKLHEFFLFQTKNKDEFLRCIFDEIASYDLSCSFHGTVIPKELKKEFPKTYYAKYNKESYNLLKKDFNEDKTNLLKLYLLLIYGFNHMIRFNKKGEFNLPVGDVDFNKNVYKSICDYLAVCENKHINLYSNDFIYFLNDLNIPSEGAYIYFDPPYLISSSEYNKYWNEDNEIKLYNYIDKLDEKGFKFGLTNLVRHKGMENSILINWSKKYKVYNIDSNYISFNDNTIKKDSKEVFVTNYEASKI